MNEEKSEEDQEGKRRVRKKNECCVNSQRYFCSQIRQVYCGESRERTRKNRNVMLVWPTNCGKTFLLNPLNMSYNTFTNPASSSFGWVGAEKAECLFLNDFRWSSSIITLHDFLLLLEEQLVHLPAPKTHYAKDITFNVDTPIFATGKGSIVFCRSGIVDERETDMLAVRRNIFTFHAYVTLSQMLCRACFGGNKCYWE